MRRVVLLFSVAVVACHSEEAKPERVERREGPPTIRLSPQGLQAAGLELVEASRASFRPSVVAGGFVRSDARRSVTVRAPGSGRVAHVGVDVGASVKRGETLAVIESSEASGALSRSRAATAREAAARRALERAERLVGLEAMSAAERDSRRTDAEAATAEATAARQDLTRLGLDPARQDGRLFVATPVAGTVLEVSAVEGGLVEKDAPLAVVANLSQVWAIVETPATEGGTIEEGAPVEVRSDSLSGRAFPGRVALVEPVLGESAGRLRVRVVLENSAGALRPGLFVTTDLPVSASSTEGTAVPSEAIQRLSGISAVFVESSPGTFELRPVETGREAGGRVEVRRGLREGERVVSHGAFVLKAELLKLSVAVEEGK